MGGRGQAAARHHLAKFLSFSDFPVQSIDMKERAIEVNIDGEAESFLLISDVHFDSPHCRRDLLGSALRQATERSARIMILGDWFDLMQGRDDPRRIKRDLMVQFLGDYLDDVIEESVEYLRPYLDLIVMVGSGNHENSVAKRLETSPTRRLAKALGVDSAGYNGWVRFSGVSAAKRLNMFFTHGSGGGGVTKGANKIVRRSANYHGAHIVASGHIHEAVTAWHTAELLSPSGVVREIEQLHVVIPGFKAEHRDRDGWAAERELGPRTVYGGMWLDIWRDDRSPDGYWYDARRVR